MLTPSEMELLSLVVFKEQAEELTVRLLNLGIFHPADIRTIEGELKDLTPLDTEKEYAEWEGLEARLRATTRLLNLSVPVTRETEQFTAVEIKAFLNTVEEKVQPLLTRKEERLENLKKTETILSQVKDYVPFPIKKGSAYTFLEVELGTIEEKNLPVLERSLKDVPHLGLTLKKEKDRLVMLVIGLKRDRAYLSKVLKDLAWEPVEYPEEVPELSKEVQGKLNAELEECHRGIAEVNKEIEKLGEAYQGKLAAIRSQIMLQKALLRAKKYAFSTGRTFLISGWIPREEESRVVKEVRAVAPSAYVEIRAPQALHLDKEQIPVRLKHGRLLKSFDLLISSYGLPRYGTIDPTVFVAISFLVMFGAMFGDLGHGLVLILVGFLLRKSRRETVRQAAALLAWCGASSCLFGLLYGSVFGLEEVIPALWNRPFRHIGEAFRASIFFGIGVLTLGIVLNVVNALRDRDYFKVLFDKAGLIVGMLYWVGIGLVSKSFIARAPVPPSYVLILIAGVCVLFLKPVLEQTVRKKSESMTVAFMESAVDILEIIMGYLANTISFIRIAAFALAHVGLFMAIFELSRLLSGVGGNVFSFLVIFFGNILVLFLEGMVVSIQSLRLNYYEFFSKFFVPGREEYKPLTR